MRISELIIKLQELNPDAEVFVHGGGMWEDDGPQELERILPGEVKRYTYSYDVRTFDHWPTKKDTVIVLSQ